MTSYNQNRRSTSGSNNRGTGRSTQPSYQSSRANSSISSRSSGTRSSSAGATRSLNSSSTRSQSSGAQRTPSGQRGSGANYQRPSQARSDQSQYQRSGSPTSTPRPSQQQIQQQKQASQQGRSHSNNNRSSRKPQNTIVKKVLLISMAIVVVFAAFCVIDGFVYKNKIRNGVSVGGLSVGGMSTTEASQLLMDSLNGTLSNAEINIYDNDASMEAGQAIGGVNSGEFDYSQYNGWYTTADALGAHYDAGAMAENAYNVGRGWDLLGRVKALFHLARLPLTISYNQTAYDSLVGDINATLGTPTVNADINFNGSKFEVSQGNDGNLVVDSDFQDKLKTALTTDNHDFVLKLGTDKRLIDVAAAQEVADELNSTLGGQVRCSFEQDSCNISSADLAGLIDTEIDSEDGKAKLTTFVDSDLLKDYLKENLIHDKVVGYDARDAQLYVYDGTVTVIPQLNGEGIDYKQAASDMYDYFVSDSDENLEYTLTTTALYPEVTTEEVEAMNISESFSSYTTSYNPWNTNSVINVRLLADTLNGTLVAPGETFSILQTSGNCNEEKGYRMAAAYFEGKQIMEAGGGICQVATTLFNAVYNAGYPIVERSNHYYYVKAYPDGLDAAISWPDVDFKFKNDTDNWIMIAFAYDDFSVTCSLWGVDPEYDVESTSSEPWDDTPFDITEILVAKEIDIDDDLLTKYSVTGVNGHSIEVTRVVRKNGSPRSEQTFISRYAAKTQVDLVREFSGKAKDEYWLKEDGTIEEYDDQDKKKAEEEQKKKEEEAAAKSPSST